MNGGQRNATNVYIWVKQNDLNYDGNCTARHCLSGRYEISGRWIFVWRSVHTPYCNLRHFWRCSVFPHYFIKTRFSEKRCWT